MMTTSAEIAALVAGELQARDDLIATLQARVAELEAPPTPSPTSPPPPPDPIPEPKPQTPATTGVLWGMSSPRDQWDTRVAQVEAAGGRLRGRRLFATLANVGTYLTLAKAEAAKGRTSVISISADGDAEWDKYAAGGYDPQLNALMGSVRAAGLVDHVYIAVQHEPFGDGTASHYAAMQRHLAGLFRAGGVRFVPILNGYGWSNGGQKMTDAQYAAWLPDDLVPQLDAVFADCYQGGTTASPGENAGVKIRNFSAWATRKGAKALGLGEFNGLDAASIKATTDAVRADDRFVFAAIFNSSTNNRAGVDWTLTGDRLAAFQSVLEVAR